MLVSSCQEDTYIAGCLAKIGAPAWPLLGCVMLTLPCSYLANIAWPLLGCVMMTLPHSYLANIIANLLGYSLSSVKKALNLLTTWQD